ILKHFWPLIRKQRLLIAGSFAALFAGVALRVFEPWPLKFIFDQVLGMHRRRGAHGGGTILDGIDPTTLLVLAIVALLVIHGLRALADYITRIGFAMAGNRVLTAVRDQVFRHLQKLSLSFHTKAKSGDLLLRVMSDIGTIKDVTVMAALPLVANVLVLAGMLGMMFWLHSHLALLALATVPVFWFGTVFFSRRIQQVARKQRKREAAMAAGAAETIGGIKTVQALCLEERLADSFVQCNKSSLKQDMKGARLTAAL